ncbi:uncharacterized protein [Parasteatoda tepidariorum]|uniref:uncharacterized protein n=1 Tax=Parasteatoda tepidariorum TaxID=114398 RepID=UPI0039BC8A3F
MENQWREICKQFGELNDLKIPRYNFFEAGNKEIISSQLHIFSDASLKGYGTVAYIRSETSDGHISTCFVSAKNRIAPLKMITLLILELPGALLSVRLFRTITRAIKIPCDSSFWCDSSIVCCWIKTPAIRFKQFVLNRLEEIQEITQPVDWFHCPGIDNPADLISRGASMRILKNSDIWWKGPHWLSLPTEMWPELKLFKENDEQIEYRKKRSNRYEMCRL